MKTFVFSSSATVYGSPQYLPLDEKHPRSATNPYGQTKIDVEDLLANLYASQSGWSIAMLRYFNPAGAHPSGLLGENPRGAPNNLMPLVAQVAAGQLEALNIFGADYQTHDGTCVRDYIHVTDLALGHVAALDALSSPQILTLNLGTGVGYSVLDVLSAYERACGKILPRVYSSPRPGDVPSSFADSSLAFEKLGWKSKFSLEDMCLDSWNWKQRNLN